jgi:hypothetical protein
VKAIPRPLLILFVVVVVLGFISCGAAGLKGDPGESDPSWDFKPEGIPIAEVGTDDGCSIADTVITVPSACTLTIEAKPFPPRELRLEVLEGTPFVSIVQEVRDHRETNSHEFEPGATFGVSGLVGEKVIAIDIQCVTFLSGACRLEVVED